MRSRARGTHTHTYPPHILFVRDYSRRTAPLYVLSGVIISFKCGALANPLDLGPRSVNLTLFLHAFSTSSLDAPTPPSSPLLSFLIIRRFSTLLPPLNSRWYRVYIYTFTSGLLPLILGRVPLLLLLLPPSLLPPPPSRRVCSFCFTTYFTSYYLPLPPLALYTSRAVRRAFFKFHD